jgi:hypothetical protein
MCEWKEKKCWHLKFSSMSYVSNCGDQWHINLNLNNCIFFLLFRECWLEIWQWRSKLQTLWQRQFDFDDRVPTGPRLLLVRTGSFLQLSLYNHISLGWKKKITTQTNTFLVVTRRQDVLFGGRMPCCQRWSTFRLIMSRPSLNLLKEKLKNWQSANERRTAETHIIFFLVLRNYLRENPFGWQLRRLTWKNLISQLVLVLPKSLKSETTVTIWSKVGIVKWSSAFSVQISLFDFKTLPSSVLFQVHKNLSD